MTFAVGSGTDVAISSPTTGTSGRSFWRPWLGSVQQTWQAQVGDRLELYRALQTANAHVDGSPYGPWTRIRAGLPIIGPHAGKSRGFSGREARLGFSATMFDELLRRLPADTPPAIRAKVEAMARGAAQRYSHVSTAEQARVARAFLATADTDARSRVARIFSPAERTAGPGHSGHVLTNQTAILHAAMDPRYDRFGELTGRPLTPQELAAQRALDAMGKRAYARVGDLVAELGEEGRSIWNNLNDPRLSPEARIAILKQLADEGILKGAPVPPGLIQLVQKHDPRMARLLERAGLTETAPTEVLRVDATVGEAAQAHSTGPTRAGITAGSPAEAAVTVPGKAAPPPGQPAAAQPTPPHASAVPEAAPTSPASTTASVGRRLNVYDNALAKVFLPGGQSKLGIAGAAAVSAAGTAAGGAGTWFGLGYLHKKFPKVMNPILGKAQSVRATVTKGVTSAGAGVMTSRLLHMLINKI